MKKNLVVIALLSGFVYLQGCSRKTVLAKPTHTTSSTGTSVPVNSSTTATGSTETAKAPVAAPVKRPAPIKTAVPKSITVNDKAATRTVQGRYYYDLEGKRYWRNKNDGKYYLYYKGMFEKPEFQ